jgi:hypothetical protein
MTIIKNNITIRGNGHWLPIDYDHPEWSEDIQPFFMYKGERYWLEEFLITDRIPEFSDFDGYASDSFFSGVVIKRGENEYGEQCVKAYTYYS